MGVSQNKGYLPEGPYNKDNKDYSLLGSILGSPYLGKPPNVAYIYIYIYTYIYRDPRIPTSWGVVLVGYRPYYPRSSPDESKVIWEFLPTGASVFDNLCVYIYIYTNSQNVGACLKS